MPFCVPRWVEAARLSCLLRHFVARLRHDSKCYIHRRSLPKHLRLRLDTRLVKLSVWLSLKCMGCSRNETNAVDGDDARSMQSRKSCIATDCSQSPSDNLEDLAQHQSCSWINLLLRDRRVTRYPICQLFVVTIQRS